MSLSPLEGPPISTTPRPEPETREQAIARMEANGDLVKDCMGCQERYNAKGMPFNVFAPHHRASSYCESGKRNHCTCDRCF